MFVKHVFTILEKKILGYQKKYPGLASLNVLHFIRVYGAYYPFNMDSSVFVHSVFLCVFSVFVLDGYHRHASVSHLAKKSYYKSLQTATTSNLFHSHFSSWRWANHRLSRLLVKALVTAKFSWIWIPDKGKHSALIPILQQTQKNTHRPIPCS